MAKTVLGLGISLLFVAGCQQQGQIVQHLPNPSFDGPSVRTQSVVAPPVNPPKNQTQIPQPPVATNAPREWIPPVAARPWRWIVVHHSATPAGGAAAFDRMHREKGWDELGYHFVIGNGTDTADGQIEVGSRWPKQKYGAHTKTVSNEFNNFGIGICLVGNFDNYNPTPKQMQSLARLTAYLMKTYKISSDHIVGHRDCKSTDCPGRHVDIAAVRRLAQQALATSEAESPATVKVARQP